jgi:hypothetical protein
MGTNTDTRHIAAGNPMMSEIQIGYVFSSEIYDPIGCVCDVELDGLFDRRS